MMIYSFKKDKQGFCLPMTLEQRNGS